MHSSLLPVNIERSQRDDTPTSTALDIEMSSLLLFVVPKSKPSEVNAKVRKRAEQAEETAWMLTFLSREAGRSFYPRVLTVPVQEAQISYVGI